MGRHKSNVWQCYKKHDANDKSVVCKFCSKTYKFANASKMKEHIRKCIKCPKNLKTSMRAFTSTPTSSESGSNSHTPLPTDSRPSPPVSTPTPEEPVTPISSSCDSFVLNPRRRPKTTPTSATLPTYVDFMNENKNTNLNKLLAKAIFVSGTPLSVVEHPLWKDVFKKIRPAYTLPSRKSLSTTYLDDEFNRMQKDLTAKVQYSKNLNLQSDGWSNIRNEGIINFIITIPEPVFVTFVDTKTNKHTSEYLAEQMILVMEKYGPDKFFTIIGDNAANMQKAFKLVQEKYPHIITLGCMAHTLNLLCNDILKSKSVERFMGTVVEVVKIIRRSQFLSALLSKINSERHCQVSLKLPVKTRWGSFLYCLQSLKTNKVSLQKLAVDEAASKLLPKEVKSRLLNDSGFWVRVDKISEILEPIVSWITRLESNTCYIHKVYDAFNEIETKLKDLLPDAKLNKTEEKEIITKAKDRKKNALGPIHLAATLLDPSSQGSNLSGEEQVDAMEFVHKVSVAMNINAEKVLEDLANYRSKNGLWSKDFLWISANCTSPLAWWQGLCGSSHLSKVAVRILSSPVTSAATERSFSTFSWIHNKKRNRLSTERAGKITYISHNWRLIHNQSTPTTTTTRALTRTPDPLPHQEEDAIVLSSPERLEPEAEGSPSRIPRPRKIFKRSKEKSDTETETETSDDDDLPVNWTSDEESEANLRLTLESKLSSNEEDEDDEDDN